MSSITHKLKAGALWTRPTSHELAYPSSLDIELAKKEHPMESLKEKRKKENICIFRKSKKGEIAIRAKSDIQ